MKPTLTEEKDAWVESLRALMLVMGDEPMAEVRMHDLKPLEMVVSKLHDLFASCAREGVSIKADEQKDFELAKRRVERLAGSTFGRSTR